MNLKRIAHAVADVLDGPGRRWLLAAIATREHEAESVAPLDTAEGRHVEHLRRFERFAPHERRAVRGGDPPAEWDLYRRAVQLRRFEFPLLNCRPRCFFHVRAVCANRRQSNHAAVHRDDAPQHNTPNRLLRFGRLRICRRIRLAET